MVSFNMNSEPSFPMELLQSPVRERIKYFEDIKMYHPKFKEVYNKLLFLANNASEESIIFVYGPTRVGKTFLGKEIKEKIIMDNYNEIKNDLTFIPVVRVEAPAPERGDFIWKDFYIDILEELNEVLINKKIQTVKDNEGKIINNRRNSPVGALSKSLRNALIYRGTKLLIIDEAHHLAKTRRGIKLKDQMDVLKSLVNLTGVPIILIGTYELLELRNQSDQLSSRGTEVHFPRYQAGLKGEFQQFVLILKTLQKWLPLKKEPNLLEYFEFFYIQSLGCIGLLKKIVLETFKFELLSNPNLNTLTKDDFTKYQMSREQCKKIKDIAIEGENELGVMNDEKFLNELLSVKTEVKETKKSGNSKPGERQPKRDPVENQAMEQ